MMRLNRISRTALLGCAALAGTLALPAGASADGGRYHDARFGTRQRDVRHSDYSRNGTDVRIDINIGQPRVEPVYEERTTRVWVEPVYQTVCDRVWIEPVYQTACDRVWEPDRWAVRDVVYFERGCRVVRKERVLVERGHWRTVERPVQVSPGHWQEVQRQQLVCEGHWEYRTERVQVGEQRYSGNPVIDLFAQWSK